MSFPKDIDAPDTVHNVRMQAAERILGLKPGEQPAKTQRSARNRIHRAVEFAFGSSHSNDLPDGLTTNEARVVLDLVTAAVQPRFGSRTLSERMTTRLETLRRVAGESTTKPKVLVG